jgi:hypothetical protein
MRRIVVIAVPLGIVIWALAFVGALHLLGVLR